MTSSDKNIAKYALIGTGAVAAVGIVVYLMSGRGVSNTQLLKEIDELGPIQREANGILTFNYYKDIFMVISKHARLRFAKEKQKLLD
jgi:hypothetical protein